MIWHHGWHSPMTRKTLSSFTGPNNDSIQYHNVIWLPTRSYSQVGGGRFWMTTEFFPLVFGRARRGHIVGRLSCHRFGRSWRWLLSLADRCFWGLGRSTEGWTWSAHRLPKWRLKLRRAELSHNLSLLATFLAHIRISRCALSYWYTTTIWREGTWQMNRFSGENVTVNLNLSIGPF